MGDEQRVPARRDVELEATLGIGLRVLLGPTYPDVGASQRRVQQTVVHRARDGPLRPGWRGEQKPNECNARQSHWGATHGGLDVGGVKPCAGRLRIDRSSNNNAGTMVDAGQCDDGPCA